jgi:hypothetical protein
VKKSSKSKAQRIAQAEQLVADLIDGDGITTTPPPEAQAPYTEAWWGTIGEASDELVHVLFEAYKQWGLARGGQLNEMLVYSIHDAVIQFAAAAIASTTAQAFEAGSHRDVRRVCSRTFGQILAEELPAFTELCQRARAARREA